MFCNKLIYSESLLIETSAYRQWRDRVLLSVNHGKSNDTMSVFVSGILSQITHHPHLGATMVLMMVMSVL